MNLGVNEGGLGRFVRSGVPQIHFVGVRPVVLGHNMEFNGYIVPSQWQPKTLLWLKIAFWGYSSLFWECMVTSLRAICTP